MEKIIDNIEDNSEISATRPNSMSLRTTIPKIMVKAFGLEPGDVLNWRIAGKDSMTVSIIKKGDRP